MSDRALSPPSRGADRWARIGELDALRGLSALAVGLYHFTYFVPFMVPGAPSPAVTLWWGCYGVQLFFAISGFVILGTLERTRDLQRFARARARRLLPEYWLGMALTAGVAALFGPERLQVDLVTWVLNLAPVQLWTGVRMVDGVYWSLNYEIGFYAAMALLWRLGATRRIEAVVACWMAAKLLLWAVAAPPRLQLLFLADQAVYFAVGLLAWRVWTGERRWRAQLPVLGITIATAGLTDRTEAPWLLLGIAPLFLALAAGRLRGLAHPVLLWMGWVSYPFYLLHGVIGYATIVRLEAIGVGPGPAALGALAVTVPLAALLAAWCERRRASALARPASRAALA